MFVTEHLKKENVRNEKKLKTLQIYKPVTTSVDWKNSSGWIYPCCGQQVQAILQTSKATQIPVHMEVIEILKDHEPGKDKRIALKMQ